MSAFTSIMNLLSPRRPATIARAIVAVIVDAVQGVVLWASAHIFQEGREVAAPRLIDGNASATVVSVAPPVSAVTAALHRRPCSIFPTVLRVLTMRPSSSAGHFAAHASAARGMAGPQVVSRDQTERPTRAATMPHHHSMLALLSGPHGRQSSERLGRYVNDWHGLIIHADRVVWLA